MLQNVATTCVLQQKYSNVSRMQQNVAKIKQNVAKCCNMIQRECRKSSLRNVDIFQTTYIKRTCMCVVLIYDFTYTLIYL